MVDQRTRRSRLLPADVARIGLTGLRTGRLRTALAILGIAVGIAALVAVIGVSESSKSDLVAQLDRLGTDLLTVQPGTNFLDPTQNELPRRAPAMIAWIPPVRNVTETVNTHRLRATNRQDPLVPDRRDHRPRQPASTSLARSVPDSPTVPGWTP